MNSPDPFGLFISGLCTANSFTEGARRTASFIRANDERCEAPLLFKSMLNAARKPRQRERLLFSLLDVSRADFDIVTRTLRLRHLRRLFNKAGYYQNTITPPEQEILGYLQGSFGITSVNQLVAAGRMALSWMRQIAEQKNVGARERSLFAFLLNAEATLLKERTTWLSDHVDPYNMFAIARLMPLLTVCDEQRSVLEEIAQRLENGGTLGRPILSFEYSMKSDYFEKWLKKVGTEPSLHPFLKLLGNQRTKLLPTVQLVAVSTLARLLHTYGTPELTWISYAHACCTSDGFLLEAGESIHKIKPLLVSTTITVNGTTLSGTFADSALTALVGPDMLSRHLEEETVEPSARELVTRCISKDTLLIRLLDNPKVSGTPGLVAYVATASRSLNVLQKIARTLELYTGQANRDVPLALLKNPSHIPLLQLRPFISVKFISLLELKSILHNPYGIRREVYDEIRKYVEERYR